MKILPTLLTSLTLLTTLAPMAKADLASDYGTQANNEEMILRVCEETWKQSQFEERFKDGSSLSRYYFDDSNNKVYQTAWNGYQSQRCVFVKQINGTPLNVVQTQRNGKQVQLKIEGNDLIRYIKSTNGNVSRVVYGQYRF
jgi:hypothetical protein